MAGLLSAVVGVCIVVVPWLSGIEQATLAARFSVRGPQHPRGISIVAVDGRSFGMLRHRWPFPRSWEGRVLEQLHRAGARQVFFDIQFTEPTTPQQDGALFAALGRSGGATLATTETDAHGHSNVLGGDANLRSVHSQAASSNLPVGAGGVMLRVPYALGHLDSPAITIARRLGLRVPARDAFSDGGAYVDYQGGPGTFPMLSFSDVLRGHFPASLVRGRIIVIGATSPTLQDLHATPVSGNQLMSGAEIQANAIWTVLQQVPLRPAPPWLSIILVLLLAIPAPVTRLRRSAGAVAIVTVASAAVDLLLAQGAFDTGMILPVIGPLVTLVLAMIATLVFGHLLVTRELRATQLEIVHRLGRAAEARDGETGRHLERMAFLCERLALAAGVRRAEAQLLRRASALHDIGKIAVPDRVLLKAGAFDEHDRDVMATHAGIGASMLRGSSTSLIQVAEVIALTHHEHWDGSGYPRGLQGEAIPLVGRICAICDVFDALICRRRYKDSWTLQKALDEIADGAGTHFDPELTKLFLSIAPRLFQQLVESVDRDIGRAEPPTDRVPPPPADDAPASEDDPVQSELLVPAGA